MGGGDRVKSVKKAQKKGLPPDSKRSITQERGAKTSRMGTDKCV